MSFFFDFLKKKKFKYHVRLRQLRIRPPTLALKPRGDVTRSLKQEYQWPNKRDMCPPKVFIKKVLSQYRTKVRLYKYVYMYVCKCMSITINIHITSNRYYSWPRFALISLISYVLLCRHCSSKIHQTGKINRSHLVRRRRKK